MNDRFDEWKIEISEKKPEDKEEILVQDDIIKWSKKRKIITFTSVLIVAILIGTLFFVINNSGSRKYTKEEQLNRLLSARAYKIIVKEYLLNSDMDIVEKRIYKNYIKTYYDECVAEFEKTGKAECYDEARLLYDSLGGYVTSMDESELEEIADSRAIIDEAIYAYDNKKYPEAYTMFECIDKNDYLYDQAQDYIKKILESNKQELELVIWYTDGDKKKLAKQVEVIANEYKEESILNLYDIKFKYVFVEEDELEERMKNEAPDIVFGDIYSGQINRYRSVDYMVGTDILFVNSDYFNEREVRTLDLLINKNNPGLISNIYIPLYEKDGFELFMYTRDFYIDQYYEEFRPENGMVMYQTNMREESSIDVMDMTRKLALDVYTDSDGIELFKQGKIGAVITTTEGFKEMREALGDKLEVYTLPYYSLEESYGEEAYFLQGDVEAYSCYYNVNTSKYDYNFMYELMDNRYCENITQYVWDNYSLCGSSWNCGVSEDELQSTLGIKLSRQLEDAEFVYMDDKKLYEERIGEVCDNVMRAGSREEIKAYLDSIEWIADN